MKILLLSVDFTPHRDGVSTLSRNYALELAACGHDVMITGPSAKESEAEDRAAPYKSMRFPGYTLGFLRILPFSIVSIISILKHRPDIVLPMNIGYGGILCFLLSLICPIKYAVPAYAYEFLKFRRNNFMRKLYNRIYRRSCLIIAISEFTKQSLIEFGVESEKIKVIFPGISLSDLHSPTEKKEKTDSCILGTCARLVKRKGHDLVIKSLPALARQFRTISYVIAGTGPELDNLKALTAELGVEDKVTFLGEISDSEKTDFYRSIDLFVMPSRDNRETGHVEGFGIVYLEAAIHSIPSVATNTGGIPEAVLHGQTGILIEQNSTESLITAVSTLLRDPEKRITMGTNARNRLLNEFNWKTQIRRLDAILREMEDKQ